MAYYKDLREYIKALEDTGLLIRIKREINKDTELHTMVGLGNCRSHEHGAIIG